MGPADPASHAKFGIYGKSQEGIEASASELDIRDTLTPPSVVDGPTGKVFYNPIHFCFIDCFLKINILIVH